jgi:hypothetical protein
MGELLGGLVAIIWFCGWVAFWVLYGVGWVLYHFFAWLLPPILGWLGVKASGAKRAVAAWHADVTFERRLEDETKRTLHDMDALGDEYVRTFEEAARRAEQKARLTTKV